MKYLVTNSTLDRAKTVDKLDYSHCEGLDIYSGKSHKFIGTVIDGKLVKPLSARIKNTIMVDGKRKVCRIWDNQGETLDRYTIAFKGYRVDHYGMVYPYLASSEYPFHSFGQHGESREFLTGRHLGKRVSFESLPEDVKKFILQNI